MKTAWLLSLIFLIAGANAQKYLVAYNNYEYQKAIDLCNKELEKNKSDLNVYLYKSLAYARLAVDVESRNANKMAAEKALNAMQVILLKDKSKDFQNVQARLVDSVFNMVWEAAFSFYLSQDYWYAKRIVGLINEMIIFPKALHLEGKMMIADGNLVEGLNLYNEAAKTIYLDNANGKKPDQADMCIFTELAEGIYQTHDLHSAFVIMDRCMQIFERDTAVNAYLQFIELVNNSTNANDGQSEYDFLLAKTDSLELLSGMNLMNLRWAVIENSFAAYESDDALCPPDNYMVTLFCEKYPSLTDSACSWLADGIVKNTAVTISYGKPKIKIEPCFSQLVQSLNNCNNRIMQFYQNSIADAIANDSLVYASHLLYNLLTNSSNTVYFESSKKLLIDKLQRQYDEQAYDVQMIKLLMLFADDKPVQTFIYNSTQKQIADKIAANKFSEAGALLKVLMTQNPNDAATLNLQKQWVIADYKYHNIYADLSDNDLEWNRGSSDCDPGKISQDADSIFLNTLNYLRRLAGVPDSCVLSDSLNRFCQAAANVMDKNGALSHAIDKEWSCYSEMANMGASNSNLSLGYHSTAALKGQVDDSGSGNESVGHRRWILNPYRKVFGHGSTTNAMALWALGGRNTNYGSAVTDAYEKQYILWPPAGYVPAELFCQRWSVSLYGADFSDAKVRVTSGKKNIPVTVYKVENGYGLPTLVFSLDSYDYQMLEEIVYQVSITGLNSYGSKIDDINYDVRFIQIEP